MILKAGTKAPDFKTKDQDGNEVSLASLRGKKVVLYFYPKDMTSGCTAESCNLRDHYSALQKAGYEVFGVSKDDEMSHRKFIEKESLPFRLLADTNLSVHKKYKTWIEKSMYGRKYMGTARVTYLIDEKGIIDRVIDKVDTRNHASQIFDDNDENKVAPKVKKVSTKPKKVVAKSRTKKKK